MSANKPTYSTTKWCCRMKDRSIMEMVRIMLNGKGLPNSFWAKAVNTVVYILNRSATKAVEGKTPQEAYSGKKPSVAHLKVFGSECFMYIPNEERTRLAPQSHKCIFLGYDMESMEDERPSPSSSEITCTHDERLT